MSDWLDGLFTEQHLLFLLCLICISGFAAVVKIIGVTADSIAKHLQEIQDSLVESIAEAIRDAEYEKRRIWITRSKRSMDRNLRSTGSKEIKC